MQCEDVSGLYSVLIFYSIPCHDEVDLTAVFLTQISHGQLNTEWTAVSSNNIALNYVHPATL